MTAIVCQFLWSGIAPSGDDKSQSSGPEYMLKVSCDVLKLSVIYGTYNLHAFMVVNNYRNKRHFSL